MATAVGTQERLAPAEAGQLAVTWKRFRKHRLGLIGLFTPIVLVSSVILVPILSPFDQAAINDATPFVPAGSVSSSFSGSHTYILGTDDLGRDNLTRLFYGGRISLAVGLITTVIVVFIGSLVGALAGFYGGWVDTVIMRLVEL